MIRRLWIAGGVFLIVTIIYLSLTPVAIEIKVQAGDKLGHLLAYGALMAWWSQLCVSTSTRLRLGLGFVALGAVIEIAQGFTPARSPELLDLAADIAGVLLGWLASPPRIPNLYARLAAAFPGMLR
jgi:VanZ family protein